MKGRCTRGSSNGQQQYSLHEIGNLDSDEPMYQFDDVGSSRQDEQEDTAPDIVTRSNHCMEISLQEDSKETRQI